MTFTVPGDQRSVTLTPEQTAAAGAGVGTGHFLFFRITAVRKGPADTATRAYPFLLHTGVHGEAATGTGTALRVVQYNMHVASKDIPGHPWKDRQHLIAENIARANPTIASIQELMPTMWTDYNGGVGLDEALKQAGAGKYVLTRTTPYWKGDGQDTHILYDPTRLTMVSNCPDITNVPSCYIQIPDPIHKHVAAYAEFRVNGTSEEFYFVSCHLSTNDDAKTDALRGQQTQAIVDGINQINTQHLPVIFGSDANDSQTSIGTDAVHQTLLDNGWYNTLSAATVVNGQYNSVNHYTKQSPSPYGFGSMYDTIETLNMPGADRWKQVLTGSPWPSDHNMIFADLRLP
jgi:endonuclease/exonuclease/phosphatase family metal-dependent hydrolase